VAKAVSTARGAPSPARPAAGAPPSGPRVGGRRANLGEYFRSVWEELKKVAWPTRDELLRMTGIVIATVILFAAVIGGADYVLSLGVKQVYSTSKSTTQTTPSAIPNPNRIPRVTPLQ
jgi:preprotein translocase subunit SecE